RDFTVNAIAIALDGDQPGELIQVPHALDDLEAETLRVLHPRSFIDDPTRLLRLARYATRLCFAIDPQTRELAVAAVHGRALDTASGAGVGPGVRLLAREPDPIAALQGLAPLELDAAIHAEFGLTDPALARRALAMLPPEGRRDDVALGVSAQ